MFHCVENEGMLISLHENMHMNKKNFAIQCHFGGEFRYLT